MINIAAFLPFLAFLACPIGMGLMAWFMMRDRKGSTDEAAATSREPLQGSQIAAPSQQIPLAEAAATNGGSDATPAKAMNKRWYQVATMCLEPKVIGALVVVALAVWVLAPGLFWPALLVLVAAVCPFSMLFMMRGMNTMGAMGSKVGHVKGEATARYSPLQDEA